MDLFPPAKPTVLLLDDGAVNLSVVSSLLHDTYRVLVTTSSARALDMARQEAPNLVLLDVDMPSINGFDVCRLLKADPLTCSIPVIFLTSRTDSAELGLDLGAVDHITRPIDAAVLRARVRAHVTHASHASSMRVQTAYLEYEVARRSRQLTDMQEVTILALASLAKTRDTETGNHLRRSQGYVRALADNLRLHARFSDYLTPPVIDLLCKCAPLHDIGKVGIPDRILLKRGVFDPEEFAIMKTHPTLGRDALIAAQTTFGEPVELFEVAKDMVYCHHEKWDGSGYPQGLSGDAIPIPARLMALADVYDALISRRVYKGEMAHGRAVQIIVNGRGSHFDPDVVDSFLRLGDEFQEIASTLADSELELAEKSRYIDSALAPL